ncbi:hypothetical protein V5030_02085 [Moellerella wisconsensis]|uniref:hypothetical protein n=1 Tax=Moellerella wisconsensis TaxID=158849 RepID=UPI003076630F
MSIGAVTFFEYTNLGFYQYGGDYNEPLDMDVMLKSLHSWYQNRISLEDTLLWDDCTPGYSKRKKVYLKSIEKNEDTGDYIVILWRAIGSGDGVYGIKASARLDDEELYDSNSATNGDKVIWGEAAYYWFIPELNVFASIRFPNSVADTEIMNLFIRDFINLHSDLGDKQKILKDGKDGPYISTSFAPKNPQVKGNLWFRIYSKQYLKHTTESDLEQMAKEITHFVKRDVIAARVKKVDDWTRFFKGLPFVSSSIEKDTRKVEINIEAKPTPAELGNIFEQYKKDYDSDLGGWRNLGFKKEGSGKIFWLNSYVIRTELPVDDSTEGGQDDTGHYTASRLFLALKFRRYSLLLPFSKGKTKIKSRG